MKLTLATAIKNEGPYLLEWISFYKALGFDDIVIFSNDNDDGSDELLHELQMAGYIQWRPRKLEPGESPQVTAFNALSKELLRTADGEVHYLAWFDCDEYLVLHRHTTVQEMIESYEHPDGLFINWKHFGSSGLTDFEDRLTIERFTRCSSTMSMNKFGKCITRVNPKLFSAIQHHRPIAKSLDNFGRIIYCSPDQGTPVSRNLISGKHPASDPEALLFHEVCQLNHYATRTPQEYAWKKQRGGGYTYQRQYRDDYFRMRDQNAEIDTRCAQRYGTLVNERVKEFPAHILACHANIIKMKTLETI